MLLLFNNCIHIENTFYIYTQYTIYLIILNNQSGFVLITISGYTQNKTVVTLLGNAYMARTHWPLSKHTGAQVTQL